MAATPTVFILNADLHLEPEAVQAMENGLLTLNNAACVGPQGSFVNYQLAQDYLYFDKAGFDSPISVDAISGFLFAIKRELFGPGGLKFEESYTPCYFEEWDLGIQIRQKGMNCWVVPTTAYMHHWSGSIAARREIDCMGRSETAADILRRNRILFLAKWQREAARTGNDVAPQLLAADRAPQARAIADSLVPHLPENPELLVITGYCHALLGDAIKGRELLKQAFRIAPERAEALLAVLEDSGMQHRARSLS
jgi:tetratricopeptide (TPR) repeat protein